jgi:phosphatidylinositol 4-kinase
MQSAAKVPILVAFKVDHQEPSDIDAKDKASLTSPAGPPAPSRTLACIFKVGDDVRQDVLALQVVKLLKDAFVRSGLDLYLCPYGCLPTGYERGVIEVVPKTKSRAGLGEMNDAGLHEIFKVRDIYRVI